MKENWRQQHFYLLLPFPHKYLSVGGHIHQNVSASEVNEGQPILDSLAPTHAKLRRLASRKRVQPSTVVPETEVHQAHDSPQGVVHHGGVVRDIGNVTRLFNKRLHIIIIITTVHADMLFNVCRVRPWDHYRDNQVVSRPFIMAVCAGDIHCQRHAPVVDQQVNLAPLLAAIHWVFARLFAAQRGRTALAVNRLPLPFDLAFLGVELDHDLHDLVENASLLPRLEAFMQGATAHPEPLAMHRFSLTTGPQQIPNAIDYRSFVCRWAPWSTLFRGKTL